MAEEEEDEAGDCPLVPEADDPPDDIAGAPPIAVGWSDASSIATLHFALSASRAM